MIVIDIRENNNYVISIKKKQKTAHKGLVSIV